MTEERKAELKKHAGVMLAAAEGEEIERFNPFDPPLCWKKYEGSEFDWVHFNYRVKKVPTVNYIPFTAETFKPHRDRWVCDSRRPSSSHKIGYYSDFEIRVDGYHGIEWESFLDSFIFEDTNEPCGQRVEE